MVPRAFKPPLTSTRPPVDMSGDGLDVQMAADGSVAKVTGRDGVHLNLPATDGTPPRNIRARALEADGEPGKGLTSLRFRDDVIFEEDVKQGGLSREVRAQSLDAALDGNGLSTASFGGGVTFKDRGLQAGALNARYEPTKNTLSLLSEKGPRPFVTDDKIHVEAREIEVTLDSHGMAARGNVRTTLSGRPATSKERDGENGRLPGLLKEGRACQRQRRTTRLFRAATVEQSTKESLHCFRGIRRFAQTSSSSISRRATWSRRDRPGPH